MPFSRLLLIAANTRKYIAGKHRDDKVELKSKDISRSQSNELVLFFQIDDEEIRRSLNMQGDGVKCCDGLIFYAQNEQTEKVICLVEMKSSNTGKAAEQIGETRKRLKDMLEAEFCGDYMHRITWKACLYRSHAFLGETESIKRDLVKYGFKREDIVFLDKTDNDIGPLLRGKLKIMKTSKGNAKHRH